jgi:3-deoxy-D-manno-octulosonic acid (KDO) 8-phosphate synthase
MAKKYRRLLYQNRLLFFVKCSIDPEGRSTVHKYRAEYGVHAYEKLEERCKELLEEQES